MTSPFPIGSTSAQFGGSIFQPAMLDYRSESLGFATGHDAWKNGKSEPQIFSEMIGLDGDESHGIPIRKKVNGFFRFL